MGSTSPDVLCYPPGEPSGHSRGNEDVGEALRQTEQTLTLLVNAVEEYAIILLDPEGRVATWNSGAARINGWQSAEILGKDLSTFYVPEDRASGKPARLLREACIAGRVEDQGFRVRKDGSRFWADVVITPVRGENGVLRGFAKVTRDLTDRREAELLLRETEERFRLLVDNVVDYAIFMLDPSGHVVTWNSGAERIAGYRTSEILGQHFSLLYPEEEGRSGRCDRELAIAARDDRFEDEGWRVRKDGSVFWANVVITALRDAGGVLRGFGNVTRDLTAGKKAEEERIRLAQAEEAIRLRDEFLAIASHELRTPLTALHLQLQSLRERAATLDPRVAAKIERATQSSNKLADLVEALLDASHASDGRLSLVLSQFDLADAARELVDRFRPTAENARCEIVVRCERPVLGRWDRTRIDQILTNLLSNAIKYGAGHPIEITIGSDEKSVRLEVQDQGPGIAEADIRRIFGRFERAVSLRNYGGLGIGLYITREIVHAHGGSISARNVPSGGACLVVELPLGGEQTAPAPALAT
jgi:PAS domain S-box-containing protein